MKITKVNIRKYHPEIIRQLRAEVEREPAFKAQVAKIKRGKSSVSAVRKSVMKKAGTN